MIEVRSLTDWFIQAPEPPLRARHRGTRSAIRDRVPKPVSAATLRAGRRLADLTREVRRRRLARAGRPTPFVWSIAPVELRTASSKPWVVQLGGLRDHLRKLALPASFDGLEIAGYLYGRSDHPTPSIRLSEAHVLDQPGAVRAWGGVTGERLLAGRSIADRERMAGPGFRPGDVAGLVGDWHTHPNGDGTPSPIDLDGWAREFEHEAEQRAVDEYVGLILTPDKPLPAPLVRWTVNAWVVSRRKYEPGFVCEPARVEE